MPQSPLSNEDFLRAKEEITEDVEEMMHLIRIAHAKIKTAQNKKDIDQAVLEVGLMDVKMVVSGVYAKYLAPKPKQKRRGRPPGSKNKIKKGE